MPQAARAHTTTTPRLSRRALAIGTAAAAGVAPVAAALAPNPDAELIALCAELDAMERAYLAIFAPGSRFVTEAAQDAEAARIYHAQGPILERLAMLRPSTIEGSRAVAHSLALADQELFKPGGAGADRLLVAVLVGGLIGRPA